MGVEVTSIARVVESGSATGPAFIQSFDKDLLLLLEVVDVSAWNRGGHHQRSDREAKSVTLRSFLSYGSFSVPLSTENPSVFDSNNGSSSSPRPTLSCDIFLNFCSRLRILV